MCGPLAWKCADFMLLYRTRYVKLFLLLIWQLWFTSDALCETTWWPRPFREGIHVRNSTVANSATCFLPFPSFLQKATKSPQHQSSSRFDQFFPKRALILLHQLCIHEISTIFFPLDTSNCYLHGTMSITKLFAEFCWSTCCFGRPSMILICAKGYFPSASDVSKLYRSNQNLQIFPPLHCLCVACFILFFWGGGRPSSNFSDQLNYVVGGSRCCNMSAISMNYCLIYVLTSK